MMSEYAFLTEDEPSRDLPPDLKRAVQKVLKATDTLCPPPCYDASYWREERRSIAHLAVWESARAYREEVGTSREAFAVICAKRAIYAEWERLRESEKAVVAFSVDEETGEEVEFVDPEAYEAIELSVLCGEVRSALERLSPQERQLLGWHYGAERVSIREMAKRLGVSKSVAHERLQRVLERLRGILLGDLGSEKGEKRSKRADKRRGVDY